VIGAKIDAVELHRMQNPAAQSRMAGDFQETAYVEHEDVWRCQAAGKEI